MTSAFDTRDFRRGLERVLRIAQITSGLAIRLGERGVHRAVRISHADIDLIACIVFRSGQVILQDLLA